MSDYSNLSKAEYISIIDQLKLEIDRQKNINIANLEWNTRHNPIIEELEGLINDAWSDEAANLQEGGKLGSEPTIPVAMLTNLINKHK